MREAPSVSRRARQPRQAAAGHGRKTGSASPSPRSIAAMVSSSNLRQRSRGPARPPVLVDDRGANALEEIMGVEQATGDAKFIDEAALQALGARSALQQLMREPQAGRRFLLEFPGGPPRELTVATIKRGDDVLDAIMRGVLADLAIDGAVRIALAERAFGVAHRGIRVGEIVAALARLALTLLALALLALTLLTLLPLLSLLPLLPVLALLILPKAALLHVLEQLLQLVAQRLLVLPQVAERIGIAALALLPLLTLLPSLALLSLLAALLPVLTLLAALPALLILALAESACRATAAARGSCCRVRRASDDHCRRRRPGPAAAAPSADFPSSATADRAAAWQRPWRRSCASCSMRSIMLCRSCDGICRCVLGSSGRAICGFLRISSASACMNWFIAARNSSMSCLISSSLAPRSSAWRNASSALRKRACGVGDVAVLQHGGERPHRLTTSRRSSSLLAATAPVQRAQPQIDGRAPA